MKISRLFHAGSAPFRAFLFAVTLLGLIAFQGQAAPGDLDALDANILGSNTYVLNAVVQPDGKIVIAGHFATVLGVPRNNIARLNADGTLDAGFNPNADNEVTCVAVQADGKVLLGGYFGTLQPNGAASATTRPYIARVNADGTLDMGFDPKANSNVTCVAVQADGKVLLSGFFSTLQPNGAASATPRQFIARVNANGTLDTSFDPKPNSGVLNVAVQTDGKVLLGGYFSTLQPNGAASATARLSIARVNADGTLDLGFDPKANNGVESLAVQADGKVLLGGDFTTLQPNGAASATPRQYLARVNADGTLDAGFNPKANSVSYSLAVQADGKVLLGGNFTTLQPNGAASATPRQNIARLHADGTLDTGFDPRASDVVLGLAVQADGKVLPAGGFTTLQPNGAASPTPRRFLARLQNDPATQTLAAPDATQVQWARGGAAPELSDVTFELSTDDGGNWSALGSGARVGVTANWQLTGQSLPASGQLRARGRTTGGYGDGSSGLIEQIAAFDFTQTPLLTSPATDSTQGGTVAVNYTLPEAALAGSVQLTFAGAATSVVTLTPGEAGGHSFDLDATNLGASANVSGVTGPNVLADGVYTVTLSYQDALGSPAATAASTNVAIYTTLTPPGYYSDTGYGPGTPADPGYFVADAGSMNQTLCPAGAYTDQPAATAPILAPAGTFVPFAGATSATQCDAGYYTANAGSAAETPADPGFFVANAGSASQTQCEPGTYTDQPASTAPILAPVGTFVPFAGAISATLCDAGYYTANAGSAAETPADPGFFVANAGSASQTQCMPGTFTNQPASTTPLLAPAGTFVPFAGASAATLCDPGFYTANAGSIAETPADPGFFVANAGSASETQCLPGTYTNLPASITPIPAPAGSFVPLAGATSATLCDAGYYTANAGSAAATPADPGFYVPNAGATAQTACVPGYFTDLQASTAPKPAQPGFFVDVAEASGQILCPLGTYTDQPAATTPILAPPGSFVPVAGATSATLCDPGYYTANAGSFAATPADPGFYVPNAGASAQTSCVPGYYTDQPASTAPQPAAPGSYVPGAHATAAILADRGYYVHDPASILQTPGDAGYYVPAPGATDQILDPPGTYSHVASVAVRRLTAPRDHVTVVGPEFLSNRPDGTVSLGPIDSARGVGFNFKNNSADLGFADALTDLGFVTTTLGGADEALAEVTTTPATLHEGASADLVVTVLPGGPGAHAVDVTVVTDEDAVPGTAGVAHHYTITWSVVASDPTYDRIAAKGGAVPGAGSDARIPGSAIWQSFGVPAIDESGAVTFLGKWRNPPHAPQGSYGSGIFGGSPAALRVAVGDGATDETGAALTGVKFKSFKDPVASPDGVAFLATLGGAGVVGTNNMALYHLAGGTLRLVAREGQEMPGAPGSELKGITSAAVDGDVVLLTGILRSGPGGVTNTNDSGAWRWDAGTLAPVVREGAVLAGVGTSAVKSFRLLKTASGSAGTGRGLWRGDVATFQVAFADLSSALVDADATGAVTLYASGAATVPGATGAVWAKFGPPATPGSTEGVAFLGTLKTGVGGVVSATAKRLFFAGGTQATVALGDVAPGLPVGTKFSVFKDPVISPGAAAFAFAGTAKLGPVKTTGVWWLADGGALHDVVAAVGAPAPAPATGVTWAAFKSLAATDSGPLFTARLGGATSVNDMGLWATDSTGALRQLLREGDSFDSGTIKSFTVLQAAAGSQGVRRSFTADGRIIVRITLADASTELVKIVLP